jgi:hypothetical protein
MKNPEQLSEDLQRMIELERRGAQGDPEREMKVWLDKLAEVDAERRGYLKLAAKGSMTNAELDETLAELEKTRAQRRESWQPCTTARRRSRSWSGTGKRCWSTTPP